ncbi:hypothetical protein DXV76_01985 [Rhodobacteraceae bacterium CCMM004]|nr:hypothetical protein DXV76_01985 [Rhodobacteraceae bacterium CCMM004]
MIAAFKREVALTCGFCGKGADVVGRLMAGAAGAHICDACVGVCTDILGAVPAGPARWKEMDDDALLAALPVASASVEATRGVLQAQVEALRAREVSWSRIGAALGISRQAAWERFS